MAIRTETLVIGGGVIGVCSAYYLAQQGREVTVVDKGAICSGSSYGNAGLIVPSHSVPLAAPAVLLKGLRWMLNPESPFYIKPRLDRDLISWLWKFRGACNERHVRRAMPLIHDLSRASLALYRELAAIEGLSFGYHQNGLLTVFRTERGLEEAREESHLLAEAGVAGKILDAGGARVMEPMLSPDVVGGLFFPDDAHLTPDRFVNGLAEIAEHMGVRFHPSTEVLGFSRRGRRITAVETTRGDFETDEVVLTAGSWSSEIASALALSLPIQPAKGYSVTHRRPRQSPAVPLLLAEARVAVTPMGETLRFAGTLELAGLDLTINRRRVDAIRRAAARYLTGTEDLETIEIWRGLRPCTPDGLPIIGRPAQLQNLILATGHATIGVSLGPITGKLVSQLAAHQEPMLNLGLLDPGRFK
ncbi:MAG: NAD(P)/FAD-dependent oxidoreductase [Candidatus Methylomirabilia bacterium]